MAGRDQMLWHYFVLHFLPRTLELFAAEKRLQVVFWVEDDCQLRPGVTMEELVRVTRDHAPKLAWLGWSRAEGGTPIWGAQLLGLARASAEAAVIWAKAYAGRRRALDTILNEFALGMNGEAPTVACSPVSLASQRVHEFKGRRMPPVPAQAAAEDIDAPPDPELAPVGGGPRKRARGAADPVWPAEWQRVRYVRNAKAPQGACRGCWWRFQQWEGYRGHSGPNCLWFEE